MNEDKLRQVTLDMRDRQREFFENIAAVKGKLYATHLHEASNAYATMQFAMRELTDHEKEFVYIATSILHMAVARYAKEAKVDTTEKLVKDFVDDMPTATKMMMKFVKVTDLGE